MIEIIAEIGINHNGNIQTARSMASIAFECGCNLVKFQKREPELCVPPDQRDVMRSTPWGTMTYLEYKKRIEFGATEYDQIDDMFAGHWFMSVWDVPSVQFANRYDCPYIKIPSAKLTDKALVRAAVATGRRIILSTGMSTRSEIIEACAGVPHDQLTLMHAVSSYPLADNKANLRKIATLKTGGYPVGYSDHTRGIHIPTAAATMGVCMIRKALYARPDDVGDGPVSKHRATRNVQNGPQHPGRRISNGNRNHGG